MVRHISDSAWAALLAALADIDFACDRRGADIEWNGGPNLAMEVQASLATINEALGLHAGEARGDVV